MDCLVRSGPVKMADTLLKSVMSSVKIVDSPVLKHHQNQLSRPDIEYNHYGALLDCSVRERCSSPENVCGLLPDLHTRMGGFMTDADVAAYDNSFLWSEENAPELIISKEIFPAFQCSQKTVKVTGCAHAHFLTKLNPAHQTHPNINKCTNCLSCFSSSEVKMHLS